VSTFLRYSSLNSNLICVGAIREEMRDRIGLAGGSGLSDGGKYEGELTLGLL